MKINAIRSALNNKDNISLELFKNGVQNFVLLYMTEFENDLNNETRGMEENVATEREIELELDYIYIPIDDAVNILTDIGVKINETYIYKYFYSDADVTILYYNFKEIWSIIMSLSEVDFFIGVVSCIVNISNSHNLGKLFNIKVLNLICDMGLEEVYKIAEKCNSAFIAMWFDNSMTIAREKISKAIKDCGFNPMLIDQKEHNNQIVPEIFQEIKECSFVIADLTGQRGGVYYEAGYAEALGKMVILTCKESQKTHFDVAQKNTIFWDTEEDLYKRLLARIKATCII